MARLVVINRVSKAVHFPRAAVSVVLKAAERAWPKRLAGKTVAVALVAKAESRRLNQAHRGQNKATNVLSFASAADGELGDIIICHEVAASEAKIAGLKVKERLEYLFIHGLLHLLGFDHQSSRQTKNFVQAEKKFLTIKAK
ncbi:MAG: rRNA maturation RNase YbeY [Candidatus Komeilibacteria bacterium RIFCSPLOWO2_02_FULL_48_11]|uniref:Endoribonuclease YbeY n=1 Tax=Candidatus Komeilibacteria bacterium RIFCSPLOWO2_02_FULL_48_11 TaxID=1798553 RepID=A0A1G2BRC0_9BACT|nr:MAG: rRNA maturation RNase YbeY [Candidatus Komeilibacteria bacterium RIFCSPLOWO2_02_FULL_48_11]